MVEDNGVGILAKEPPFIFACFLTKSTLGSAGQLVIVRWHYKMQNTNQVKTASLAL
jgi:hypothetical protein